MRIAVRGITVLLILLAYCRAQTADEIVVKNLAARGGAEKLRAIQSMLMTGTISFGDSGSPITVQVKRPNQIREDFNIREIAVTRGFDGTTGWEMDKAVDSPATVEKLEGGALDNIREEAENAIEGPLLDSAKKGSKVELLGKDTYDSKPVYKLKLTTHMGTSITQFLDANSYLEIHEEIERSVNGKTMTIVEDVGDYRDVGGIKFAHLFVSGPKDNPKASRLEIDKMQLDPTINSTVFEIPKEGNQK